MFYVLFLEIVFYEIVVFFCGFEGWVVFGCRSRSFRYWGKREFWLGEGGVFLGYFLEEILVLFVNFFIFY